ncbi:MAG: hypothetical protein ACE5MI_01100 [Acidimicrobiia bacterium]
MVDEEPEHTERIPWAQLLPEARSARSWPTYSVIGALVVAAVAFALARRPVAAPTVTLALPVPASPQPTAAPLPVPEFAATAPPLYSEADLMAAAPAAGNGSVTGRAEWFVHEFFRGNGDDWSRVLHHLPEGALGSGVLPERGVSFVEWAQSIDVTETPQGTFEVLVAFQLLVPRDQGFERLPVRAVTVPVTLDQDGIAAVLDLPSPTPLRFGQVAPSWGQPAQPPAEIVAEALALLEPWASEGEILSASRRAGEWRLVVVVADESGNRWPLVALVKDGP